MNHEAVWAALDEEHRAKLAKDCANFETPLDRWHRIPRWRQDAIASAGMRLVRQFEAEGMSRSRAIARAAARLDVPAATIESEIRRTVQAAYRPPPEHLQIAVRRARPAA